MAGRVHRKALGRVTTVHMPVLEARATANGGRWGHGLTSRRSEEETLVKTGPAGNAAERVQRSVQRQTAPSAPSENRGLASVESPG